MPDLRDYLKLIKRAKDLKTIKKPVSPRYVIAGITAKMDRSHAIIFQNVEGSDFRLVSNLVGTRTRFAQALGCTEVEIHGRVACALEKPKKARITADGRFLENSSTDATILPMATHFEKEPGPFITSSMVFAKNPDTAEENSSFHRMMPIDGRHFSIRMVEGRHLHRCFVDAKEHGDDLRVSVVVGVHPAVLIAGAYQYDWGKSEMDLANALLDDRLTLTKSTYSGLHIPADAEIVLEGRVLKDRTRKEWMVEMLQTYDHRRAQPVFELDRLYFRNKPIFHDILSGYSEHRLLMGMPIESKLTDALHRRFSQTRRVSLTDGGCNWLHAVIQIKKRREADPGKIITGAFETHRSLKRVTIVDEDIDPSSAESVEYAVATRFQADRDLIIMKNLRGSSLDPSSDQENLKTAKIGVDATRSLSKRKEGFEIAAIPGIDEISLSDYIK